MLFLSVIHDVDMSVSYCPLHERTGQNYQKEQHGSMPFVNYETRGLNPAARPCYMALAPSFAAGT